LALDSYSSLKTEVADWLDREDLEAKIPTFIRLAEATMNRTLRTREATQRIAGQITSEFLPLPADFAQAQSLRVNGRALNPVETATIDGYPAASGPPRLYAMEADKLRFYPTPDRAFDYDLIYYRQVPALSDDNPTNWVLARHPDAYLYGTLLHAAPYLRDAEAARTWDELFSAVMEQVIRERHMPGGQLRTEAALILGRRPCYSIYTGD